MFCFGEKGREGEGGWGEKGRKGGRVTTVNELVR